MRADARRNAERIRAAAAEAFAEHGIDVPLEDIARRAGVSPGTIYHRFGSREGLTDAVVADVAAEKLATAVAATAGATPWERFSSYVFALGAAQAADPTFNAIVARRHPESVALREVTSQAVAHAAPLMEAAQADGTLRDDVSGEDLDRLIWLNAQAVRLGDDWWRRSLEIFLNGLRADR
ncbi:helix-turn-helix transcriptional regulator [Nocardioides anomalus]|uniref:Helix-turn-helix transcriptional regulator n=1 Tax=Nocardioides anomalus TaxID=2712223 RepID=A0A6G6WF09_9ACTN|nr:TetR/AcrR family transcriptional regulator [Nocardioides anomalus]QIG43918.1 helix-turn-helix transcriptional regulator [Nocardioides anomalus]